MKQGEIDIQNTFSDFLNNLDESVPNIFDKTSKLHTTYSDEETKKLSRFTKNRNNITHNKIKLKIHEASFEDRDYRVKFSIDIKEKEKLTQNDIFIGKTIHIKIKLNLGLLYLKEHQYKHLSSRERTEISLQIKKELANPILPKINISLSTDDFFNVKISYIIDRDHIDNVASILVTTLKHLIVLDIEPKLSYYQLL